MMRDSRRAVHRASQRRMQPAVCIKCGKCLYVAPRRAFRSMRMRVRAPSFFFPPSPRLFLFNPRALYRYRRGLAAVRDKTQLSTILASPSATLDKIAVIFFPTTRHTGYLGIINIHFRDGGVVSLEKIRFKMQRVCLYALYILSQ